MAKNILVFMDGTRNKPSDARLKKDTNVWKLYEASSAGHRGSERFAKYVRGVGTEPDKAEVSPADDLRLARIREWHPPVPAARRIARLVAALPRRLVLQYGASAVGWGVSDRIREAYGFICRHYEPGDEVYLFGFSRGAFEARSLAGFIDAVGLLLRSQATGPDARRLVELAYDIYRRGDEEALAFLRKFLRRLTRRSAPGPAAEFQKATEVRLHFVGVWDTVEALGVGEVRLYGIRIENRHLPVVRRHTQHHRAAALPANVRRGRHALAAHELRQKFEPLLWDAPLAGQDVQQVWFAGAHADAGGGYPETRLSDIALNWMAEQAAAAGSGAAPACRFDGIPVPLDTGAALLPHHAIQGDFFWATPAPRSAIADRAALPPAVAATFSVHPSGLARLFDAAATTYEDYPFEKDVDWTRHLPGGDQYPRGVAAMLSRLDDWMAALGASVAVARDAQASLSLAPAPGGSNAFGARRQGAWRQVASVAELRIAAEVVARLARRSTHVPIDIERLARALDVLAAFEQWTAIDRLVEAAGLRVQALIRLAARSTTCGLAVRERRLPWFDALVEAARVAAGAGPAQFADRAKRLTQRLAESNVQLRSELPMRALPLFRPRRQPPPASPPTPS